MGSTFSLENEQIIKYCIQTTTVLLPVIVGYVDWQRAAEKRISCTADTTTQQSYTEKVADVEFEMVYETGCSFQMGYFFEDGEGIDRKEPVQQVSLDNYLQLKWFMSWKIFSFFY